MTLFWTHNARDDVERLVAFLSDVSPRAASKVAIQLVSASSVLLEMPRLGTAIARYYPRDVRKLLSGNYVFHYELKSKTIYLLRIWHGREDRI